MDRHSSPATRPHATTTRPSPAASQQQRPWPWDPRQDSITPGRQPPPPPSGSRSANHGSSTQARSVDPRINRAAPRAAEVKTEPRSYFDLVTNATGTAHRPVARTPPRSTQRSSSRAPSTGRSTMPRVVNKNAPGALMHMTKLQATEYNRHARSKSPAAEQPAHIIGTEPARKRSPVTQRERSRTPVNDRYRGRVDPNQGLQMMDAHPSAPQNTFQPIRRTPPRVMADNVNMDPTGKITRKGRSKSPATQAPPRAKSKTPTASRGRKASDPPEIPAVDPDQLYSNTGRPMRAARSRSVSQCPQPTPPPRRTTPMRATKRKNDDDNESTKKKNQKTSEAPTTSRARATKKIVSESDEPKKTKKTPAKSSSSSRKKKETSGEESEEEEAKTKRGKKTAPTPAKKSRRKKKESSEEESEEEEEDPKTKRGEKAPAKGRKKKGEESEEDEPVKGKNKKTPAKKSSRKKKGETSESDEEEEEQPKTRAALKKSTAKSEKLAVVEEDDEGVEDVDLTEGSLEQLEAVFAKMKSNMKSMKPFVIATVEEFGDSYSHFKKLWKKYTKARKETQSDSELSSNDSESGSGSESGSDEEESD